MAAGAITKETKLLLLDAIFHLTSRAVNLVVECLSPTLQIGQNITRISSFEGVFSLGDHPALAVPSLGLVLKLSEQSYLFSAPLVLALGSFLQLGRERRQALILGQSDEVIDSRFLAPTQHLPTTKAAVRSQRNFDLGPARKRESITSSDWPRMSA